MSARWTPPRRQVVRTSRGWPRCERTIFGRRSERHVHPHRPLAVRSGHDVVVGMNRDESAMRPADPPAVMAEDPGIVAPRDRQAGGTWLGASGTGLVVALSNRRGRTSASA